MKRKVTMTVELVVPSECVLEPNGTALWLAQWVRKALNGTHRDLAAAALTVSPAKIEEVREDGP